MQVILLERVEKLGAMGDVVRVRDGYARNYLLPQGKALRANKPNMERFERDRETLEQRNAERKTGAEGQAAKIDGKSFVVIRQAGESGQLYGSVSTRDIAQVIAAETGVEVARNQVVLDQPIKTIGMAQVRIALHAEVPVMVNLNVARSADEAAAQARGEDLTIPADEREAALEAAALFESEELAREIDSELSAEEAEEAAAEDAPDTGEEEDKPS